MEEDERSEGVDVPLEWTALPVRDDYPRSLLLVALLVAFPIGIGWWLEGAVYGAISFLLLLASVLSYFVPTRYVLDGRGVHVDSLGRMRFRPWDEVKNLYVHRDGIFLSPFAKPSRLDPFRGTYLRFRGNAEEVRRFCERHVRREAGNA